MSDATTTRCISNCTSGLPSPTGEHDLLVTLSGESFHRTFDGDDLRDGHRGDRHVVLADGRELRELSVEQALWAQAEALWKQAQDSVAT